MNVDVLGKGGKKVSEIKLADGFLGDAVREGLLYETVKMQLASRRSGTASTKTRSEVRGSNAKPWRQKGTGRARAGTKKSPVWRHGGVAFGPRPRDYSYKMPKKAVREALRSALLFKYNEGRLKVLDALELAEPKTKLALEVLAGLKISNALIVTDNDNGNLALAVRNLKGFKHIDAAAVNVYDVLRHDELVLTRGAFEKLQARLS